MWLWDMEEGVLCLLLLFGILWRKPKVLHVLDTSLVPTVDLTNYFFRAESSNRSHDSSRLPCSSTAIPFMAWSWKQDLGCWQMKKGETHRHGQKSWEGVGYACSDAVHCQTVGKSSLLLCTAQEEGLLVSAGWGGPLCQVWRTGLRC